MFLTSRKLFAFLLMRRVAKSLQWGGMGCYTGVGAEPPALQNLVFFWQQYLNFRPILIKIMLLKRGIEISSAKT